MAKKMEINKSKLNINKKRLLYRLGWKAGMKLKAEIEQILNSQTRKAIELAEPRAVYDFFNIHAEEKDVYLNGVKRFQSEFLAGKIRNPSKCALYIATIGSKLDEEVRNLHLLEGIILFHAGSELIDSSVNYLQHVVEKELGKSYRLSPGMYEHKKQDWKLSSQGVFFDLLPASEIEVRLTESFLMLPEKSETGIILPRQARQV